MQLEPEPEPELKVAPAVDHGGPEEAGAAIGMLEPAPRLKCPLPLSGWRKTWQSELLVLEPNNCMDHTHHHLGHRYPSWAVEVEVGQHVASLLIAEY